MVSVILAAKTRLSLKKSDRWKGDFLLAGVSNLQTVREKTFSASCNLHFSIEVLTTKIAINFFLTLFDSSTLTDLYEAGRFAGYRVVQVRLSVHSVFVHFFCCNKSSFPKMFHSFGMGVGRHTL